MVIQRRSCTVSRHPGCNGACSTGESRCIPDGATSTGPVEVKRPFKILAYGCESMMLETSISLHAAQGTDVRQAVLDGVNKESWMETLNRAEDSFTHMVEKKKKKDVRRCRLRAGEEESCCGILRQSKYAAGKAPAMRV